MTTNNLKLRWTSLNYPTDGGDYHWELGTIFDFHVKPLQEKEKGIKELILEEHNITERTELIVTAITRSNNRGEEEALFTITAYVFKDGSPWGKPVQFMYRSATCRLACWQRRVDSYMVRIAEPDTHTLAHEFGKVFENMKNRI